MSPWTPQVMPIVSTTKTMWMQKGPQAVNNLIFERVKHFLLKQTLSHNTILFDNNNRVYTTIKEHTTSQKETKIVFIAADFTLSRRIFVLRSFNMKNVHKMRACFKELETEGGSRLLYIPVWYKNSLVFHLIKWLMRYYN